MSGNRADNPPVSIKLFHLVERYLSRTYRARYLSRTYRAASMPVDMRTWNRWMALLGQVEQEYRALAEEQP